LDGGFSAARFCRDDGEEQGDREEGYCHPCGETGEDIRGLRAEDIVRDAASESGSEAFAARALHEDHQGHEKADEHMDHNENWQ
jgi:hypothetical protein